MISALPTRSSPSREISFTTAEKFANRYLEYRLGKVSNTMSLTLYNGQKLMSLPRAPEPSSRPRSVASGLAQVRVGWSEDGLLPRVVSRMRRITRTGSANRVYALLRAMRELPSGGFHRTRLADGALGSLTVACKGHSL